MVPFHGGVCQVRRSPLSRDLDAERLMIRRPEMQNEKKIREGNLPKVAGAPRGRVLSPRRAVVFVPPDGFLFCFSP